MDEKDSPTRRKELPSVRETGETPLIVRCVEAASRRTRVSLARKANA
jgi:hypothetical protein